MQLYSKVILSMLAFSFLFACNQKEKEETTLSKEPNKVDVYQPTASSQSETANKTQQTNTNPDEMPIMTFEKMEFDFGSIDEGKKVNYNFKFKNTGKSPLIIQNCSASCGCTVPNCPKQPIAPGQDGEIAVEFDSAGKGGTTVNKTVTINANTTPSEIKLTIKGAIKGGKIEGPYRQ